MKKGVPHPYLAAFWRDRVGLLTFLWLHEEGLGTSRLPAGCLILNARADTAQQIPRLPVLLPLRLPAPDIRIEPQTLRLSHCTNRQQIPDVQWLDMRRQHINLSRCVSFLALPACRMHRLHFISPPMQSPRGLHLHAKHPTVLRPNNKVIAFAVSPGQRHTKSQTPRLRQKRRLRYLS